MTSKEYSRIKRTGEGFNYQCVPDCQVNVVNEDKMEVDDDPGGTGEMDHANGDDVAEPVPAQKPYGH